MEHRSKFINHFNRDTEQYTRQTLQQPNSELFNAYTLLNQGMYEDCLLKLLQLQCTQQENSPEDTWYFNLLHYQISIVLIKLERFEEAEANLQKLVSKLDDQCKNIINKSKKVYLNSCNSLICKCMIQKIIAHISLFPNTTTNYQDYIIKLKITFSKLDQSLQPQILKECSLMLLGLESFSIPSGKFACDNFYQAQLLAMHQLIQNNLQSAQNYIVKAYKQSKLQKNTKNLILCLLFIVHINQKRGSDVSSYKQQIKITMKKQKINLNIKTQLKRIQIVQKTISVLKPYESKCDQINPQRYRTVIQLKLNKILLQLKNRRQILLEQKQGFLESDLQKLEEKIKCLSQLQYQLRTPQNCLGVLSIVGKYKFPIQLVQSYEANLNRMCKLLQKMFKTQFFMNFIQFEKLNPQKISKILD